MACIPRVYAAGAEAGNSPPWFLQRPWDARQEQHAMALGAANAQQQRQQRLQRLAEVANLLNHPAASSIHSRMVEISGSSNPNSLVGGGAATAAAFAGADANLEAGSPFQLRPQPASRIVSSQSYAGLAPQPSGQLLTPLPSGQLLIPQPSGQLLTPQPSGQLLSPQPSGQLLSPQPSGQLSAGSLSRQAAAGARGIMSGSPPPHEDALARFLEQSRDMELRGVARLKTLQEEQQRIAQLARDAADVVAGRAPAQNTALAQPVHPPRPPMETQTAAQAPLPVSQSPLQPSLWMDPYFSQAAQGSCLSSGGGSYKQHLLAPRRPEVAPLAPSPDWLVSGPVTMWEARRPGNMLQHDPAAQFQVPSHQVPALEPPPPSRSPPPAAHELEVDMHPGSLGMDIDWKTGLVENVHADGQLASSGVSSPANNKGFFITSINGADYSEQALRAAVEHSSNYRLAFRKRDMPPSTPSASEAPITTSQSEKGPAKGKAKAKAKPKAVKKKGGWFG